MSSELTQTLLRAIEEADSAVKLADAVRDLAEAELVEAVPHLVKALGYNNPGAAVAAVDGLIKLGDEAVDPLLELLDGYNYGARAWALRALSGIGHPRALGLLLDTAQNDFALSVRRAAARGLGTLKWYKMEPEAIPAAQLEALQVLITVCNDPEWVVRYAGVTGLESLGANLKHPEQQQQAHQAIAHIAENDAEIAVQARAKLAIVRLTRA